jgi:hypothetical protein
MLTPPSYGACCSGVTFGSNFSWRARLLCRPFNPPSWARREHERGPKTRTSWRPCGGSINGCRLALKPPSESRGQVGALGGEERAGVYGGSMRIQPRRHMPMAVPLAATAGLEGRAALGNVARDFLEMELHGLGVGEGQRERGADASGRTNGAKEIRALAGWRGRVPRLAH